MVLASPSDEARGQLSRIVSCEATAVRSVTSSGVPIEVDVPSIIVERISVVVFIVSTADLATSVNVALFEKVKLSQRERARARC